MATLFTQTDVFNGHKVEKGADRVYTVFVDGQFRGWVSGGNRSFRFFAEGDYSWGPSATTRAKAVQARDARVEAERSAKEWRSQQVPTDVKIVRLTAENIDSQDLAGWLLDGAEELGEIVNVRLTRDGFRNAMIVGSNGRDVLGLPSTVTAYKI